MVFLLLERVSSSWWLWWTALPVLERRFSVSAITGQRPERLGAVAEDAAVTRAASAAAGSA